MKKIDDNNVTNTPVVTLTPFEKHAQNAINNAQIMRIMHETRAIVDKLGELKGLINTESDDETQVFDTLDGIADEALIGLALELENKFGISA